jgi:putative SOS response-associated peptidase YedK
MCYHTSVKVKGTEIAKAILAPFPQADLFKPIYHANGFAHPDMPVLSADKGRSIQLFNWGLIPFWVKDWATALKLRNQTLNAKSEELFKKPAYRDSIQPTKGNKGMARRCVIPVTGFYEWKHVGKQKVPYYIHPKEQPFFYLAGVYARWTDPATPVVHTSFSILTAAANELMTDIHNSAKRMPLMLDFNLLDAWIDPELSKPGIMELMNPCDDRDMAAYTVSPILSSPKVDSNIPEILDEVEFPLE